MVFDKQIFRAVALAVGIVFLLVGLLAMPAWAQDAAGDQYSGTGQGCDNPQRVETFSGTENDLTDPFEITGDTFRLTYNVDVTDPNGFPTLEVDVLDESGQPIGEGFITFEEDGSENILAGPGTFSLEIRANDVRYKIDVEDCVGTDQQAPEDNTPGDDNAVINVPQKSLPNTGGPPLLAIGFSLIVGAGLLTAVVRRRY